ncbi:MAG: hypothetical protein R6X33_12975 [Candidatus Brocadiia bacterium]
MAMRTEGNAREAAPRRWRVCLDCGTEWSDKEAWAACPDCGGPTTPTDPKRASAHKTYMDIKRDVAALLDWLELELVEHARYAATEGVDHGHAGDLGHVRRKLIETLSFLAQRDEKDIEEALDDVAAGREQAAARRRAEGKTTD